MSETPLLDKCIEIGDTMKLFPYLSGWSQRNLRQLVRECGIYEEQQQKAIGDKYKAEVFKPENFFNEKRGQLVDEKRKFALNHTIHILSEIASVAEFYLRG